MNRPFAFSIVPVTAAVLMLAACQKDGGGEPEEAAPMGEVRSAQIVYKGQPRFPEMRTPLPNGLELMFIGGPATKDPRQPVVGDEGQRTLSRYELRGVGGKVLVTSPSMLADPRLVQAGQEQEVWEWGGMVQIWVSDSGRSILINENRSDAVLNQAFLLLQQDFSNSERWDATELSIPTQLKGNFMVSGPLAYAYPEIQQVTDSGLTLRVNERVWESRFIDIPRRN